MIFIVLMYDIFIWIIRYYARLFYCVRVQISGDIFVIVIQFKIIQAMLIGMMGENFNYGNLFWSYNFYVLKKKFFVFIKDVFMKMGLKF